MNVEFEGFLRVEDNMLYWNMLLQPKRVRENTTVEKTSNDNRSPFKKDFDTVCNSTILRRLQDKAQVFPLEQEDYARTRLTHSIEVLSIAESLGMQAINVIKKHDPKYISNNGDVCPYIDELPNILKTVALLHDMGNPPFGHLGEQIIGDWFNNNLGKLAINSDGRLVFKDGSDAKDTLAYKLKGVYSKDLIHFEGNAQLLRLVSKLNLVVDENGMNLSYPVLASFIKYPTDSESINKDILIKKKVGYFTAEKQLFDDIQKTLGLNGYRHPIAYLLEAADDIAYLTADIEDAHHKGLISVGKIKAYLESKRGDRIIDKVLEQMDIYEKKAETMEYTDDIDGYIVHRARVLIKGLMIDAVYSSYDDNYDDIMNQRFEGELLDKSSASEIVKVLRKIEQENIYYSNQILDNKTRAYAVITKLLETYVPAAINWSEQDCGKDTAENLLYLSLSKNYRYICELANKKSKSEEEKIYNKLLLVTDQVSGMTDTHALTVYKKITAT